MPCEIFSGNWIWDKNSFSFNFFFNKIILDIIGIYIICSSPLPLRALLLKNAHSMHIKPIDSYIFCFSKKNALNKITILIIQNVYCVIISEKYYVSYRQKKNMFHYRRNGSLIYLINVRILQSFWWVINCNNNYCFFMQQQTVII